MRIILLIFLPFIALGCATRNINYNRTKIINKYSSDYNVFLDNQKINLNKIYLDKNNIENVRIDKRNKNLNIDQLKSINLVEVKQMYLDSISKENKVLDKNELELLVVIDGMPVIDDVKMDTNSIKSFTILSQEKMNNLNICRALHGVVVITTK
jgi:hypothetical protein